jgi:ribosomal-protein-alanine N-acetyltransferase
VGERVYVRRPQLGDATAFIAAVKASGALHRQWVQAPSSRARFASYVRLFAGRRSRDAHSATYVGLIVCRREDDALLGVLNFSEIIRGVLQSGFLGYYALSPHAGEGYMSEGLSLAIRIAFDKLRLHRIEVNIQPGNKRSSSLVRRAGFRREGFSPRYAKIAGRWRDHVRWALLVEDWRANRRRLRS